MKSILFSISVLLTLILQVSAMDNEHTQLNTALNLDRLTALTEAVEEDSGICIIQFSPSGDGARISATLDDNALKESLTVDGEFKAVQWITPKKNIEFGKISEDVPVITKWQGSDAYNRLKYLTEGKGSRLFLAIGKSDKLLDWDFSAPFCQYPSPVC